MKIEMRGRWGCGCDMRACELHQREVETYTGALVVSMSCHAHMIFVSGLLGLDAPTKEGLDTEVTRLLNLAHEQDCR